MVLNFLKKSSFITVPSLYLLYLNKRNEVIAREPETEKLFKSDLTNSSIKSTIKLNGVDDNIKKLTNQPVTCLKRSKQESINLAEAFRVIGNVPGVVCGVSYQGKEIWSFGNGLADLEAIAPCTADTIMRIASISKAITMFILGKLLEEGKLDLDKPINEYLAKDVFPQKYFENKKVNITLRQLVSHLSGIRHYLKDEEFYLNEQFENVYDTLKLFKDDDLLSEPGQKYLYSTYGFSLISSVIQSVLEKDKKFETALIDLLKNELGMHSTFVDVNKKVILNRARYYEKDAENKLINVKEVNNSNKIAGGGLLSNVSDLLKFANAMLYSYKTSNGVLKQETIKQFWTQNETTKSSTLTDLPIKYAMGFQVSDVERSNNYPKGYQKNSLRRIVFHTGSAAGAVSILLILPEEEICVAIMANLNKSSDIQLSRLAMDIAKTVYRNIEDIYEIN